MQDNANLIYHFMRVVDSILYKRFSLFGDKYQTRNRYDGKVYRHKVKDSLIRITKKGNYTDEGKKLIKRQCNTHVCVHTMFSFINSKFYVKIDN